jgi:hypothetical protein
VLFLEISFNPVNIRVPLFVLGLVLAFTGVYLINSLKEEDSSGQVEEDSCGQVVVQVDKPSVDFSGLKWLNTGDSLPTNGRQLENPPLARALTRALEGGNVAVLRAHRAGDSACTHEFSQVFLLHRMCSTYSVFSDTQECWQEEWDGFGIADLRFDDFIKAGDCYFQPAEARTHSM